MQTEPFCSKLIGYFKPYRNGEISLLNPHPRETGNNRVSSRPLRRYPLRTAVYTIFTHIYAVSS